MNQTIRRYIEPAPMYRIPRRREEEIEKEKYKETPCRCEKYEIQEKRWTLKRTEQKRRIRPKSEYENGAGLFGTEGKPAQKPTPMSPTHGRNVLKNAAIRSAILAVYEFPIYHKYFRPRSHRVEVAASGDPRTNGDSTLYYFYYYQESKATGRPPLPTNSSLQTLKLQPHASPHLGTDLRIAQLSNIGSFDHH
ncbi:hypothetical protein V1477_011755 [Vespula maculifrons]|uniref:Uncharacterized protein n=1 Tax=Vespula maculifrons TaxID=7453 RepID=A0ABD2C050_VESMC